MLDGLYNQFLLEIELNQVPDRGLSNAVTTKAESVLDKPYEYVKRG